MDGLEQLSPSAMQRLSSFSPSAPQLSFASSTQLLSSISQTQTHLSPFKTSPLKLAKAGFEYLPSNNNAKDTVICKACKLVYHSSGGESPMLVHMIIRPECPFIKAAFESTLRHRSRSRSTSTLSSGSILSSPPFTSSTTAVNDINFDLVLRNMVRSSSDNENQVQHLFNIRRQLFPSSESEPDSQSLSNYIPSPFIPKDGDRLMLYESHRKLTFKEPSSSEAALYAAAGFKFCENIAACVFCELRLEYKNNGSSIDLERSHEDQSPNCPFVKGFDVNISSDLERQIKANYYLSKNLQSHEMENNDVDESMNIGYPVMDFSFEKKEARIRTYKTWPRSMRSEYPPQIMAECGLYYSGGSDSVQCFCCGVRLFDWKDGADPFTQHARASQQCLFLTQLKGSDFVRDAQHEKLLVEVDLVDTEHSGSDTSMSSSPASSYPSTPEKSPPSSPLGSPCLNMDAIEKALACGYSQKAIADAVRIFFHSSCGQNYPNEELLERYLKAGNKNHEQVCEQREEILKNKTELKVKDNVIQAKDSVIQAKDSVIQSKDSQLQDKDSVIQAKDSVIIEAKTQLQAKERELARTRGSLDSQEKLALVQQIAQQNEVLQQKDEVIEQKDEVIEQKDEELEQKDEVIEQNREELEQNREELDLKQQQIDRLEKHNQALMEALKQIDPSYMWNGRINTSNNNDNLQVARCLMCYDKPPTIAFLPCGHLCSCVSCAPRLQGDNCPVCRGPKESYEFIFV